MQRQTTLPRQIRQSETMVSKPMGPHPYATKSGFSHFEPSSMIELKEESGVMDSARR